MVVVVRKELKTLSVKVIRTSLVCCSVFWEMKKLKDETPHNTPEVNTINIILIPSRMAQQNSG